MSRAEKNALERPPGLSDAEWAKVLVRWEHAERWVAWTLDTEEFLAAADTHEEIHKLVEAAGIKRASYEWVPPPFRSGGSMTSHEVRLSETGRSIPRGSQRESLDFRSAR